MANTPEKPQMSDDERADLKAMIAAGRELSPEMDESLVESYAQRRSSEAKAKAKVQGKEVVAQPQSTHPLAGINPAVAITGIVAMAAVFIVIMVASNGAAWWLIFPLFGIFGGWMGNNDRRRVRNERRAQRYQMRADYYRRRMGYPDDDDARLPESAERDESRLPSPASSPAPQPSQTPPAPRSAPPASATDMQPPINPAG
jgi:hypothetical protein